MVRTESPSYNSSRIQRAFRINNIEQSRLSTKLQLLEKEKVHAIRVTNQDIRLISLTLDYIQTCSGNSAEGFVRRTTPSPSEVSLQDEEEDPCFLYGERISSRRTKRDKRPASGASSTRYSSALSMAPTKINRQMRPQSSPQMRTTDMEAVRNRAKHVTDCMPDESCTSENSLEMSTVTRKLLESQAGTRDRQSVFTTGTHERPERSQSAMSRVLRTEATLATLPKSTGRTKNSGSRKSSLRSERGITDILNKSDIHTMSSQAWKNHLNKNRTGIPMTYSQQQERILSIKKSINSIRELNINVRMNTFMSQHPMKSTILKF